MFIRGDRLSSRARVSGCGDLHCFRRLLHFVRNDTPESIFPKLTCIIIISSIFFLSVIHNSFAAKIAHTSPAALIVMPDDGARPLEQIISDAGKSLDIVMHNLDDQRILKAISKTAKRGVKVRIILEKNPVGVSGDNDKARKRLESAGAFVKWADPKFEQTFQKTIIVDKNTVYVSTFDFTEKAIDGSRGFVIKVVDPREVDEIVKTFEADWNRKRINPVSANLAWAPKIARMKVSDLLRNVRYMLCIYSEKIKDQNIVEEIGRSIKRGVVVKVLIGDWDQKANEPGIVELSQLGARVLILKNPILMTNMILADAGHATETAFVGSVTLESSSLNTHRGLSVRINDQERLKQLKKIFEKDWERSGSDLKDEKLNHK